MIHFRKTTLLLLFLIGFTLIYHAQTLEKQFDKILSEQYLPNEPGAAALVAVDGKIIYQKGFGMANLELDVQMKPDMIFEIGSITKQFTAVSILMLMEQGKLNLNDDITEYIEDYPTHGHHISIHHLLTHTSGIKSYTSMEDWTKVWRKDFEPLELIDLFKNEPMDFDPGDEYLYNNSAYIILGYIIEQASGQSYEEFIESNIFKPLGMESSLYGSKTEIIKNRASGYQKQKNTVNAEYLSMTQPYAAGSLMSNVEDLFIWNRAIRSNQLVKEESINLAYTNYKLNNGEKINYGYGWGLDEINGSPTIEHSGGIFGYVTNSIYLPEEDVFVAVFSNCDYQGPGQVSTKMAALAIGKPYPEQKDFISVKIEDLQKWVGVYDFADSSSRIITLEGNQLFSQRLGSNKFKLMPTKKNLFSFEDSFATIQFKAEGGQTTAVFANRTNKIRGIKTERPIPAHNEIQLEQEILERYLGVYEINPEFDIIISLEDKKLMSQGTRQMKFQLFAETQTKFFLKEVDAQIEFIESDKGGFDSFIIYQGGYEISGKKKN